MGIVYPAKTDCIWSLIITNAINALLLAILVQVLRLVFALVVILNIISALMEHANPASKVAKFVQLPAFALSAQ